MNRRDDAVGKVWEFILDERCIEEQIRACGLCFKTLPRRWNDERAIFAFPFGGGFWDDDSWSMLLPFFYTQHDAETDRTILLPFLWIS